MVEAETQFSQPFLDSDLLQQIIEAQSALAALNFDLEAFMTDVVNRMRRLTQAAGAVIELVEGKDMVYRAASGSVAAYIGLHLKAKNSLSGLCVHDAKILISEDTSKDPRVDAEACKKVGAASMVVVPLFRWGTAIGVLKVLSSETHAFRPRDVELLRMMAGLLGAMLGQRIERQNRTQKDDDDPRLALNRDSLTGLPNRSMFRSRLSQAIARCVQNRTLLALAYLDIDHFKPVNDNHGREKGDALLRSFATRIGAMMRQSDTLSRLGGDEFTVILEDAGNISNVTRMVSGIIEASRREFDLGGLSVRVGVSAGIATTDGLAIDPDALILRADGALFRAKKAGGASFRIV